jgi:SAM-dependent methyltransferase
LEVTLQVENEFPKSYFTRYDESDDSNFYLYPRLTVHIDDAAIKAVSQIFLEELQANSAVLDLMSSYRSHIPPELPLSELVGLGLNDDELRLNSQLTDYIVHDLNTNPRLPYADERFDGCICTVSVQYMTRPIEVFAEVGRVLKPGAPFIVTFSNRCFPSKAVRVWVNSTDAQHTALVQAYFQHAGCFTHIKALDRSPNRWISDPLYAVVGRKG